MRACFRMVAIGALAPFYLLGQNVPRPIQDGYMLPNGWKLSPAGKSIASEDMVTNLLPSLDKKAVIALHSGFNPHGLVVVDAKTDEPTQRLKLKSAWLGLAWRPDGKRLYVSGGNADGRQSSTKAPIYSFDYENGKLSEQPASLYLDDQKAANQIYWSGLAHHPRKKLLYAANRGTTNAPGQIVIFDTESGKVLNRIGTDINPYDVVLTPDGGTLFVSNWASSSVSVIDTETQKVTAVIQVGRNPNDMTLAKDGRLYVSCSNDNSVVIIDTAKLRAVERIHTAMYPQAPEGSTPNAVLLDPEEKLLFVANADNNNVAVISIAEPGKSQILGFIPSGWYPSSLAFGEGGKKLYIGNSKGSGSYSNIRGPHSPLPDGPEGKGSVKSLMKGSVQIVEVSNLKSELKGYTRKVFENCPYNDDLLAKARPSTTGASIIPQTVGVGSPVKHVIYILKENRTYDQVFGDIAKGNGDPRLTIFGRKVTPNHHALAEQFVLLDNLHCDGEVSVDGHSWSNAAYATDFNEKLWPVSYGGHSKAEASNAYIPAAGHLWDQAQRKGLTYRSYGEYARRASDGNMEAASAMVGLTGHVAPGYKKPGMRDTDNAREFIREFDEFDQNYDSADPNKRLPNYVVMSLPEDHTVGTRPGLPTPVAAVASNDYALGMIVDRVTHSKYWKDTAIFVIEDDAQDGPDHVDARRTVGLAISPYIKRGTVDSTLYTTSGMIRTMELLLGLQPMSQFDAAATPMYASFGVSADPTPYVQIKPEVDIDAKNVATAWGAKESLAMDFSDVDRTPMYELNEIVWKSVKGADSPMPLPVRRYLTQAGAE